jgi:hypothetical protein
MEGRANIELARNNPPLQGHQVSGRWRYVAKTTVHRDFIAIIKETGLVELK